MCSNCCDRYEMSERNDEYSDLNYNFCNPCVNNENFNLCSECGATSLLSEVSYYDERDEYLCSGCANDCVIIHDYSYKPDPIFHVRAGESRLSVPMFGIELETECDTSRGEMNEIARVWDSESDGERDYYLKFDGSLQYGIEVVTHPRSLASWRDYCDQEFATILAGMSRRGVRAWSTSTAGLHVHVGQSAFKDTSHLARFALLFNRNEEDAVKFANRRSSYASFTRGLDYSGKSITLTKVKEPYEADHSDAVNLYGNRGVTVEVRIFRPSLAVARVLASIEMVAAAVEYTRSLDSHDVMKGALKWHRFAHFLDQGYPCASAANDGQRFAVATTLAASLCGPLASREDAVSCA